MKRRIFTICLAIMLVFGMAQVAAAFDTSADTQMLWLINVDHPVDKNYKANDLVLLDSSIYQNPNSPYMRAKSAEALKLMLEGVEAAGFGKLTARSGYRSYATQSSMFNTRIQERQNQGMSYQQAYNATKMYTAIPGTSEHQGGFAQDLSNIRSALNNSFGDTAVAAWLRDNSWRYGFILRYTEEKINYTKIADEPWHFRYVGTVHAQLIHENGWCYEEYIEYLHQNHYIALDTPGDYIYEVYWTDDTSMEFENIVEISSDNAGGWIITTCSPKDIFSKISGHWAEQSFIQLLDGKEFNYPKVIDPNAAITRGDFAMLYDLLGEYLYRGTDMTKPFAGYADVPETAYNYEAISRLGRAKIMVGTGSSFGVNDNITREATAAAIANIINDNTIKIISYKDLASIAGWAFQSVQKVSYQNLMVGDENKNFNPKGNLKWGEAAVIILRLQNYLAVNQPLQPADPAPEAAQAPAASETDIPSTEQ